MVCLSLTVYLFVNYFAPLDRLSSLPLVSLHVYTFILFPRRRRWRVVRPPEGRLHGRRDRCHVLLQPPVQPNQVSRGPTSQLSSTIWYKRSASCRCLWRKTNKYSCIEYWISVIFVWKATCSLWQPKISFREKSWNFRILFQSFNFNSSTHLFLRFTLSVCPQTLRI